MCKHALASRPTMTYLVWVFDEQTLQSVENPAELVEFVRLRLRNIGQGEDVLQDARQSRVDNSSYCFVILALRKYRLGSLLDMALCIVQKTNLYLPSKPANVLQDLVYCLLALVEAFLGVGLHEALRLVQRVVELVYRAPLQHRTNSAAVILDKKSYVR